MKDLKVIANEMLPVYETSTGEKVVIARELHEKLMVNTRFNDWINRQLENYGFVENEDFYSFLSKTTGRPSQEYLLTLDTGKEIAMVQNNEMGRTIRKYFIAVEKRFREQQPKSYTEMFALASQAMLEQERRLSVVETRLIETEKKQKSLTEIISLNNVEWRKKVNTILQRIAKQMGGYDAYRDIRNESYKLLEQRANCKLSIRLTNKQQKMALEGVNKSRIGKVTKMDVISEDSRLTEIYLAIVKELAIKYQVEIEFGPNKGLAN